MDIGSKILTLIICTYNRNDIIGYLLNSIQHQSIDPKLYEILIVNNFNNAKIHNDLVLMVQQINNARVIFEPKTGLSKARNTGIEMAKSRWVGFVDDDCVLPIDFISNALSLIQNDAFDCFGGHIKTFWLNKKPRWLMNNYGSKPYPASLLKNKYSLMDISTINHYFNWGGNIFFRKSTLELVGRFDEKIGMKGNRIGYSAENRVQMELRKCGFKIGYDPELVVEHLIALDKLSLSWHLKSAYCEARDARLIFPNQYSLQTIGKDFLRIFHTFLKSSCSLILNKQYFWENWFLDSFKPLFKFIGKLKSFNP